MKLNTHPENRKDMVKAISELIELPSAYGHALDTSDKQERGAEHDL